MLPNMKAKVRQFLQGLGGYVNNEVSTAILNSNIHYGKIVAFTQAAEI